jgi:lysophospholipase L1-like esterase
MPAARRRTRPQGVLAFGDSITNAGGDVQFGTAMQSWALWTARALGVPYTPYAVDGATVGDVTGLQIPLFRQTNFFPDARYHLGCLYVGTNDVRSPDWDPIAFEVELDRAAAFLAERCDRLILPNLPLTVGRPPNPERIKRANTIITSVAANHSAIVLDLREFRARNLIMADHVHPTAYGQIAIAERALDLLAADGFEVRLAPHALISAERGRYAQLHWDVTYVYRAIKARWRQLLRL